MHFREYRTTVVRATHAESDADELVGFLRRGWSVIESFDGPRGRVLVLRRWVIPLLGAIMNGAPRQPKCYAVRT